MAAPTSCTALIPDYIREAALSPIRLIQTTLLLLAVTLAGCGGLQALSPAPGATPQTSSSPQPVPTPASIALDVSAPAPGRGAVKGTLVAEDTSRPYVATLYLGRAIPPAQPGFPPMISFSEQSDPKAAQDPSSGAFGFKDVAPGTYALILWSPVGNKLIEKPGTKESVLVDVKAGEVSDLGTISIR